LKLVVRDMDIATGGILIAVLNEEDARRLDLFSEDRIKIKFRKRETTAIVDIAQTEKAVPKGHIGLFEEVLKKLNVKDGDIVDIDLRPKPSGVFAIKKKLDGIPLKRKEIFEIIKELVEDKLSQVELTYFIGACYTKGMTLDETVNLTKAIVHYGGKLKLNRHPILDKHCLSWDVPVMIRNSGSVKVKSIGEVIDNIFAQCDPADIVYKDGAEFTSKNLNGLCALTYNEAGEVEFKPVSGVFRAPSPRYLYLITLRGNRTIKVTPDHTIFVLKKGKIKNIPACSLKKGDFVIVPSGLKNDKPIKEIELNVKTKKRGKQFKNVIKITPEFIRFLGYYITEGFANYQGVFLNFGSHEKDLIKDAIYCIKKVFKIKPTINYPHKTAVRVTIYSQNLSSILHALKVGKKALEKSIPSFLFDVSDEMKLEFLRTLFKCDGHTRRGYETAYVTVSKKLAIELQYLLSMLGMSSTLSIKNKSQRRFPSGKYMTATAYTIYTQARNLFGGRKKSNVAYINLIPIKECGEIETKSVGWEFRRCLKRQKFMTKEKLLSVMNYIKSEDVKKLLTGHLSVLEVKNIKKIKSDSKYVYDFKIDGFNKFMVGSAPICVHNCSGGVPGNRTSMLIVPIIAAAGYTIPKTSSRSITSPAGTADTMEVLAPVALTLEQMKKIVLKTNGCIVWGGAMELASADDKLIKLRDPLALDPEGMLLASILAKKAAVGATHVLIDIPLGKETKIKTRTRALSLEKKFKLVGKNLGMNIRVMLSDGKEPIGNGIGPILEAKTILWTLMRDPRRPRDLERKAVKMATLLLEMVGEKKAHQKVINILKSGEAYKKMKEIIEAQGGDPNIKPEDLVPGPFKYTYRAPRTGHIANIDCISVRKMARAAGAPKDKDAGMFLYKHEGESVLKDEPIFTLYAHSKEKLRFGLSMFKRLGGIEVR